jgi:ABC-type multidrug transport system ATPase subunit
MNISIDNISKRFGKVWIFRDLSLEIPMGSSLAITGRNGSGKSTLLQIISSYMDPTIGKIDYDQPEPMSQISFVSPYLELIEELTLWEHLDFHFTFKKSTIDKVEMLNRASLTGSEDKLVGDFSSGMKQRLKLILAFFSETSILCLDEPTVNLDESGINWYREEIMAQKGQRTIIIASNQRLEFDFCEEVITVEEYKLRSK